MFFDNLTFAKLLRIVGNVQSGVPLDQATVNPTTGIRFKSSQPEMSPHINNV